MSSVVASANTVVVVGAGIAGLSAARAILDGDTRGRIKVIVLEARDRPGGRAYAALMPGTDINVDLGASWIHGPDNNPVTEVATLYGGVHVPVPMPFVLLALSRSYSVCFCVLLVFSCVSFVIFAFSFGLCRRRQTNCSCGLGNGAIRKPLPSFCSAWQPGPGAQ